MEYKTTRKLFRGTYQYKIVLICAGASWFRNRDMDKIFEELKLVDLYQNQKKPSTWRASTLIKTQDELDYAFNLASTLVAFTQYELRVESPWITIYSNNKADIDRLVSLDITKVKYVSQPDPNVSLAQGTIVMPKMAYEFRVTMGKTVQPNLAFVEWADTNKKCKLTKSCIRDLGKQRSWGGTHFYITGDNNLLMAKMHLGGAIAKIERIVKS